MRIRINRKHINDGQKTKSERCPVALAISEFCDTKGLDFDRVSVGASSLTLYKGWHEKNFLTSTGMFKYITSFDQGKEIEPLDIELVSKDDGPNIAKLATEEGYEPWLKLLKSE